MSEDERGRGDAGMKHGSVKMRSQSYQAPRGVNLIGGEIWGGFPLKVPTLIKESKKGVKLIGENSHNSLQMSSSKRNVAFTNSGTFPWTTAPNKVLLKEVLLSRILNLVLDKKVNCKQLKQFIGLTTREASLLSLVCFFFLIL